MTRYPTDDKLQDPPGVRPGKAAAKGDEARAARLKAALKANIARRKAQAAARKH